MGPGTEAEALLPGFKALGSTDAADTAGILIAGGTVIHPQRYVRALWRACQQAAARGAFPTPHARLDHRVRVKVRVIREGGVVCKPVPRHIVSATVS